MRKEEFYFDSRDGQNRIHAVRYTPDEEPVVAVVQIVHGMAEYVERYEAFAEFLTQRGIVVTGEDHLGHGKTVPEGGLLGYCCEHDPATVLVRDVHRLKKMTQTLYPEVPYIILGHSMGSFIAHNYMCRYGSGISAVMFSATGMQPGAIVCLARIPVAVLKAVFGSKHVSKLVHMMVFGSCNKRIDPLRTAFDWLSRDEEIVDAYNADPLCGFTYTLNGFQTLFELIAALHKRDNLEKIPKTLPVYMFSGEEDPVGGYGRGVRRMYESLKEAGLENVRMKLYPDDRHEPLNEKDRSQVMQDVYEWIRDTILV